MSYYKLSNQYIKLNFNKKISFFFKSYTLTKIIYPLLTIDIFREMIFFFTKQLKDYKKKNKQNKYYNMLDYGSGNGAFLYFFINKLKLKNNYSFEISRELLSLQRKLIKNTKFIYIDNNKNTNFFDKIPDNVVDFSISASVFQYFRSEKYAIKIIKNLVRVSKNLIILYDIKNFELREKYFENLRKRQKLSKKNFFKKYKFTPLRFYKKKFFINNFRHNKKISKIIFKKMPKNSLDSKFGYSVLFELKS